MKHRAFTNNFRMHTRNRSNRVYAQSKRRALKENAEFRWMGRHASILHIWYRKHKHRAEVNTTNTLSLINTNAVNITKGTQEKNGRNAEKSTEKLSGTSL
jgi:hypothetical protein